jgi:hypothetical protein
VIVIYPPLENPDKKLLKSQPSLEILLIVIALTLQALRELIYVSPSDATKLITDCATIGDIISAKSWKVSALKLYSLSGLELIAFIWTPTASLIPIVIIVIAGPLP